MTNERRKDDTKIDELIGVIAEMKVLVKQVHEAMFGYNGDPGLKAKWERHQGGLQVWKGIAGSGGLIALGLLIIEIIRFIK